MSDPHHERPDLFHGMTRHPRPRQTPYGEQDENGVDWSILRANLRLTPLERLRRADAAAQALLRLRANVRRIG